MSRAEQYRSLAESVRARASSEPSLILKGEWENLAETYDRLAEQSEDPSSGPTNDPHWDILANWRH